MDVGFPEPTDVRASRAEVFLGYLDYFRERVIGKVGLLPRADVVGSRLPSGWSPLELLVHLRHVERRWLEWGFLGVDVGDPWADEQDGRWHVPPGVGLSEVVDQLRAQGRAVGASSKRIDWTTEDSRGLGGGARSPRRWSGCCSTWCRSTPATWVSWTSSSNW